MKLLLTSATMSVFLASAAFAGNGPMSGFVEEWDMDGNGAVTLEDFQTRRGDQFAMFDMNADGMIDGEEQANMAETIAAATANNGEGHGAGGPGVKIHGAMTAEYADADGDAMISADEWTAAGERLYAELDANSDGELSPADFGH